MQHNGNRANIFFLTEISEVPTVVHLHSGIPVVIHMMRRERINEDSSALPTRIIQFTTK